MVAVLVRLKWDLLRAMFRRGRSQTIGAIAGIVYFGGAVVTVAVAIALAGRDAPEEAHLYFPAVGALLMLGWVVVPLFAYGSDPTLDPGRFALFPVPTRQLAVGLVLAGCLGLPAIALSILLLAAVVAWAQSVASAIVGVVCAVIALLTCVGLSRWVTAAATARLSSRRGKDVIALSGFALAILAWVAVQALPGLASGNTESLNRVARALAWSTFGWVFAAPGDIAAGAWGTGLLRLALAIGMLAVVLLGWERALRAQIEDPRQTRDTSPSRAVGDLGWFSRMPDTPAGAVGARMVTYWLRDPRFQVGLLTTPLVPLMILVPWQLGGGESALPLLMAPLLGFLLGWSEHNSVSYEDSGLWLHIASGVTGRADRLGRLAPNAMLCAVLLPVYSVLGCVLAGRMDLLPAVVGLTVCVLLVGYAVSSIMSVAMAYPVAKPGESPFASPPGAVGATLLGQTVAFSAVLALSAPALVLAWLAWSGHVWAVWALLVTGFVWGAAVFLLGLRLGSRLFERRAPELLAEMSRG